MNDQRGIPLLVSKDANIFPLSERTRAWNSVSFSRDSSLSLHLSYSQVSPPVMEFLSMVEIGLRS